MGVIFIMIYEIDVLADEAIEKIYAKIIAELSHEQLREMRTEEYWRQRDLMQYNIDKKKVTIEFYTRYKDGLRKRR